MRRSWSLDDADFVFDHALDAEVEVRHGDGILGVVVGAVENFGVEARKMEHGFAHGLAGDGSGIDAHAADGGLLFNDRDALAGLGALDGGALTAGA